MHHVVKDIRLILQLFFKLLTHFSFPEGLEIMNIYILII